MENEQGFRCNCPGCDGQARLPCEAIEEFESLRARVRELEALDKAWNEVNSVNIDNLEKKAARIRELEEKLNRDSQFFQAEKGRLKVRIRELEEAMPHPFTLRSIAKGCEDETHATGLDAPTLNVIADRIESVMKKPKEN